MYRAMVGIGVLCGVSIVSVFEFTRPVIARNQAAALERAVFHVLPDAQSSATFRLTTDGRFDPTDATGETGELVVHAGYDAGGRLVGVAVEGQGMGYQDRIRLLYGYSFSRDAIVGFRILESRETPGLGDRVETDPGFLENFVQLDVSLTADRSRVAHPIEYVAPDEKTQPWEVDGISGATITSTAVTTILRESTAYWIPRIRGNLTDLSRGE
jgi:electron transport complex protein RnfG